MVAKLGGEIVNVKSGTLHSLQAGGTSLFLLPSNKLLRGLFLQHVKLDSDSCPIVKKSIIEFPRPASASDSGCIHTKDGDEDNDEDDEEEENEDEDDKGEVEDAGWANAFNTVGAIEKIGFIKNCRGLTLSPSFVSAVYILPHLSTLHSSSVRKRIARQC